MELIVIELDDLMEAFDPDPHRLLKVSRKTRRQILEECLKYLVAQVNQIFEEHKVPAYMSEEGELIFRRRDYDELRAKWIFLAINKRLEALEIPPTVYMHLVP